MERLGGAERKAATVAATERGSEEVSMQEIFYCMALEC